MGRKIVILDGHPRQPSLAGHLADVYAEAAAQGGHDVRLRHISDMTFDPDHVAGGYASAKALEADLAGFLDDLDWCDHVVLACPMWWGAVPAKLKGLFDRALIPGRTFSTRTKTAIGLPAPLLKGRSARVIVTSDSPRAYLRLAHGDAMIRQLRGQVFGFIGIRPMRVTYCAPASDPTPKTLAKWQEAVRRAGHAGR